MRHNKKFNHLGRKSAHRKAMLSNMASSLILHKRIETTVAKAKALKMYVEPLITKSKNDTTHSRRTVFAHLRQKEVVSELFNEVIQKIGDRPGGYTRILKLSGNRVGDNAERCIIELVDYNTTYTEVKKEVKKPARRRRGAGTGSAEAAKPAAPKAAPVAEAAAPAAVEAPEAEAVVAAPVAEETPAIEETPAEEPQAE